MQIHSQGITFSTRTEGQRHPVGFSLSSSAIALHALTPDAPADVPPGLHPGTLYIMIDDHPERDEDEEEAEEEYGHENGAEYGNKNKKEAVTENRSKGAPRPEGKTERGETGETRTEELWIAVGEDGGAAKSQATIQGAFDAISEMVRRHATPSPTATFSSVRPPHEKEDGEEGAFDDASDDASDDDDHGLPDEMGEGGTDETELSAKGKVSSMQSALCKARVTDLPSSFFVFFCSARWTTWNVSWTGLSTWR